MKIPQHAHAVVGELIDELQEKQSVQSAIRLYEKEDGGLRWAAAYSNSFRDQDFPPEIIAAQSHRNFVALVDSGLAEPPEYWVWHASSLKIGSGEWVAVDDKGDSVVFALAGGTIDEGFEEMALALDSIPEKALSHGMPFWSVIYSDSDPSIIIGHITKEVSWLPVQVAANKFTAGSTYIFKEMPTMIDEEKRQTLADLGIPAALLDELEARNSAIADKAVADGVETKEVETIEDEEEAVTTIEQVQEASSDADAVAEDQVQEDAEKVAQSEADNVVRVDVSELSAVLKTFTATVEKLDAKIEAIAGTVRSMREEQAQKQAAETPVFSLADILSRAKSVTESENTAIDGRSSLAKQKPQEAETPGKAEGPFFRQWLRN